LARLGASNRVIGVLESLYMSAHSNILTGSFFAIAASPLLVLGTPSAVQAEDVTFDPKWESGKRYVFSQGMGGKSKMKMGELEMDTNVDADFVMGIEVSDTDDGAQKLMWTYDSVKMDMDVMGQKMSFDSTSPGSGNPMLAPVFKSLTGMTVTGTLDKDGKLGAVEVEGEGAGNPMLEGFGLGKESLAQTVENLSGDHFPEKAVSVGDTWEHTTQFPVPQADPIDITTVYTYVGIEQYKGSDLPKVTYTASMKDAAKIEAQGVSMDIGKMDMKGHLFYDPSKNAVVVTKGIADMVMEMNNGEEVISLPTTQEVSMTLIEITDPK